MKLVSVLCTLVIYQVSFAQISVNKNIFYAKAWSKEIALYRAKSFVIDNVLGDGQQAVKFEIDPLVATNSGELTTLVYRCAQKNKEGLIMGFFGEYWNKEGIVFTGYAFKEIPKAEAIRLLDKVKKLTTEHFKYLEDDKDNNNLYFEDGDMTFLIYVSGTTTKIRVFWQGFDAEWDYSSVSKTEKQFLKKLK